MKDFYTLAVESSCDETSASILKNDNIILSNIISSQIDIHQKYGGVVPEVASRHHIENIIAVIEEALAEAKVNQEDIDLYAVTYGPGLVGALLVGLSTVKAMAYGAGKPFIGVHHIEGHILANHFEHDLAFPYLTLVVSGGHTHIVRVDGYSSFTVLGKTQDDAAGEAFDKVARILDLGYPGGPYIEKISKEGDRDAISFPRAMMDGGLDFSFSGLKSSVINYVHKQKQKNEPFSKADVAASFQEAVISVLSEKLLLAAKKTGIKTLTLAGGVAANGALRARLQEMAQGEGYSFYYPSLIYCTDNAAMIAKSGYHRYQDGKTHGLDLNAYANLKIGE